MEKRKEFKRVIQNAVNSNIAIVIWSVFSLIYYSIDVENLILTFISLLILVQGNWLATKGLLIYKGFFKTLWNQTFMWIYLLFAVYITGYKGIWQLIDHIFLAEGSIYWLEILLRAFAIVVGAEMYRSSLTMQRLTQNMNRQEFLSDELRDTLVNTVRDDQD